MKYRPEVDGRRAVAVLPVILPCLALDRFVMLPDPYENLG